MVFRVSALKPIIAFLKEQDVPFMVIGGIANAERGRVRTTDDADLKILVREKTISEFRALVESKFKPHHRPWLGKAESALIISVETEDGMVVDMLASILPYEEQAIQRAEMIEIDGLDLPVCAADDLIVHKVISNREYDWFDIEGILIRQRGKLDLKYIRHWLTQFAEALENPEMLTRFEELYEANK